MKALIAAVLVTAAVLAAPAALAAERTHLVGARDVLRQLPVHREGGDY